MKLSLNWLKDYVVTGIPTEKLVHKLTMAGLEVEKVSPVGDDTVLELEITPNRPDCLNMLGMAREVGAILRKPRKVPPVRKRTWPKQKCDIAIEDKKGCARYIGTLIEGVAIKSADARIVERLMALGLRPVNNVVDITNFCLLETGQPMHAFDYDKLAGGKIVVRRARKGETIITIDDVERELDESVLVIADAKRPVAIAGIMGGKGTEVSDATKNILLESAYFDPVLIRRASRKLGLSSDSSYRFERGVDISAVERGAARAVDMILESAGGKITKRIDVVVSKKKGAVKGVATSAQWINARIGETLTVAQYKDIFKRMDFSVSIGKGGCFTVTPPSFRGDVRAPEDLVEEAARVIGYDNIRLSFPTIRPTALCSETRRAVRRKVRALMLAQGFDEAITYTMIGRKSLELSEQGGLPAVEVFNPLTQDQEVMRPSLLPGLLAVVLSNVNRGQKDLRLFETGKIYAAQGEVETLGAVITGARADDWRQVNKENADYYDLKGPIEQIFARLGVNRARIRFKAASEVIFADGQGADILVDGKIAGSLGKIEDDVLDRWGIKQKNVLFAQLDISCLFAEKKGMSYEPVPEFPSVSRDISLAVPSNVTAQDIEEKILTAAAKQKRVILSDLKFLEMYEGEKIAEGLRGLIFSLTYRSSEARTLRDEEVTEAHESVCDVLVKDLGLILR